MTEAHRGREYIPYGEFSPGDGDDPILLTFDTMLRQVMDPDSTRLTVVEPEWVPSLNDEDEEYYDGSWPIWDAEDPTFSAGYGGLVDEDADDPRFRTFNNWTYEDTLVLSTEYEAWLKVDKRKAADELRELLAEPNSPDAIYTSLRGVSDDGCRRIIEVLVPVMRNSHPTIYNITYLASRITTHERDDKTGALLTNGCGMDMGFDIVNSMTLSAGLDE